MSAREGGGRERKKVEVFNACKEESKKRPRKQEEEEEEEEEDEDDDEEGGEDDDGDDNNNDDDDEEGEGDEDQEDGPPAKKAKAPKAKKAPEKKKAAKKPAKKASSKATAEKASPRKKDKGGDKEDSKAGIVKIKDMKKMERLEEARKAFKWWEAEELPAGINWRTMEHAGITFPDVYKRHGKALIYDGKRITLPAELEEIATFYASIPEDGPQLGNPGTKKVFQANFFKNFSEALGPGHEVQKFDKCDFSEIKDWVDMDRKLKKAATAEEKLVKKGVSESNALKRGYAIVDGRLEKMGNFNMEPPGLFRGRGNHPKTGELKKRTFSESVAINISADAAVPRCDLPGRAWMEVRHDPSVTWLCSWNENVQNSVKYVMLAASSSFKGKSDREKYGKAIQLKNCIHKVRRDYNDKIVSKDKGERQMGVAMWVIDKLALRVGGEKGEDEADTVGCCSLRKEHLHFSNVKDSYEIELEFLGKDSMLFKQTVDFASHGDTGKRVYKCLESFCAGKAKEDDVFETLTPSDLNKHLTSIMKGLSAKVFRTYNASVTLEEQLPSAEDLEDMSVADKVIKYNAANRQVAILCNHQKTVSKAAETQLETLQEKIVVMGEQKKELEAWLALVKSNKGKKVPLLETDDDDEAALKAKIDKAKESLEKAKPEDSETRLKARSDIDEFKAELKKVQGSKFKTKHMYKTEPTLESIEGRIKKWAEDIKKQQTDAQNKDENKEVALGTSKINYMDPRISVAWCKRCEVPIDKIFPRTLRDKFNWAMAVPPSWKFE